MSETTQTKRSRPWVSILPLFIFLALVAVFYSLLKTDGRDTSALPSALLNKRVPALQIPPLEGLIINGKQTPGMGADTFSGKLSVVNVFASWCVPCRQEHPQIMELAEDERFQIIGINHKDNTGNALQFLSELGNPYGVVGVDRGGRASIEWGVYGVPETFLVNQEGRIFYKHVGPISKAALKNQIIPLLEKQLQ